MELPLQAKRLEGFLFCPKTRWLRMRSNPSLEINSSNRSGPDLTDNFHQFSRNFHQFSQFFFTTIFAVVFTTIFTIIFTVSSKLHYLILIIFYITRNSYNSILSKTTFCSYLKLLFSTSRPVQNAASYPSFKLYLPTSR